MDDVTRKALAENWEPDLHNTGYDRVSARAPVLPERLGEKRYLAHQEARARIASVAPEALRLLLEMEPEAGIQWIKWDRILVKAGLR